MENRQNSDDYQKPLTEYEQNIININNIQKEWEKESILNEMSAELIQECEIQTKIQQLKANLAATDYQAIKYAESRMTGEEYAPIGEQRQAWRNKINELENA